MPDKKVNDDEEEFLASPVVKANLPLLERTGVISYIDSLTRNITNYKNLLTKGLEIFNHSTIDEIIEATVLQISDHSQPSLTAFLWKPNQNKETIIIKAYRDKKQVDVPLAVDTIAPFEQFFRQYPSPINFDLLSYMIKNDTAIAGFRPIQPVIVVPILGQMGLYGIVLISSKISGNEYTQEELLYFQQLMSFVSQAMKNLLHYEHSVRDVKTGLYNHGFFMTRLNEEVARAKRAGYDSSVIVMDVDKFKNFNDTYGHLAGDQVLESIALAIKQSVRAEDIPSRFGGEEFTVLLPCMDRSSARIVAERLRNTISVMTVPWEKPLPQVTISLGVCTFDNAVDIEANEIIRRADEALYLSKQYGRNRTTIWGSGLMFKMIKKGYVQ